MKSKINDLPENAQIMLDSILLGFREHAGFGADMNEQDFLRSARLLLEAGAMKIFLDDEKFVLRAV